MSNSQFLWWPLAIVLSALVSCNVDNPNDDPVPVERIPISLSVSSQTKMTDTEYEAGDVVGLYVVNFVNNVPGELKVSGNHLDNMSVSFDGTKWSLSTPSYWADQTTKADFYCYYPYRNVVDRINGCAISVNSDQSSVENYKASDAAWGKLGSIAPTSEIVTIQTKHVMSKVVVVLKPGTGWTDDDIAAASVTIGGVKCNGSFNISDGTVAPTGEVGNIIPLKESNDTYTALIIPQAVDNVELVRIQMNGNTYTYTTSMNFKPTEKYTCTLTINRVGEGVNVGIGEWIEDDTDFGGTI